MRTPYALIKRLGMNKNVYMACSLCSFHVSPSMSARKHLLLAPNLFAFPAHSWMIHVYLFIRVLYISIPYKSWKSLGGYSFMKIKSLT